MTVAPRTRGQTIHHDVLAYTMSLLAYPRRLYSLDTLDTRFTTSSKTPLEETVQTRRINGRAALSATETLRAEPVSVAGARPSKWHTWEYYVYYFVFVTIIPLMFWVPYSVSKGGTVP